MDVILENRGWLIVDRGNKGIATARDHRRKGRGLGQRRILDWAAGSEKLI
jgi:hypothetical protein